MDCSFDQSSSLLQRRLQVQWSLKLMFSQQFMKSLNRKMIELYLLDGKDTPSHGRPISIRDRFIQGQVIEPDIIWHAPQEREPQ